MKVTDGYQKVISCLVEQQLKCTGGLCFEDRLYSEQRLCDKCVTK